MFLWYRRRPVAWHGLIFSCIMNYKNSENMKNRLDGNCWCCCSIHFVTSIVFKTPFLFSFSYLERKNCAYRYSAWSFWVVMSDGGWLPLSKSRMATQTSVAAVEEKGHKDVKTSFKEQQKLLFTNVPLLPPTPPPPSRLNLPWRGEGAYHQEVLTRVRHRGRS